MSFMPTDAYRKLKDRMMEAVNELIKNTYKEDGDEVQHPTGRGSGSTARPRADGSRRHGDFWPPRIEITLWEDQPVGLWLVDFCTQGLRERCRILAPED